MTLTVPTWKHAAGSGIDEELLAEAQYHLGGASEVEAMNAALHLFVEYWRDRRGRAFDRLQAMADEGGFDFAAVEGADR